MELFIKGKMFGHLDTVSVTDAAGREVYSLTNESSGLTHRIVMKNDIGMIVAHIEQQTRGKQKCFAVKMFYGKEIATVERKPTIRPAYHVSGPEWEVTGSLFSNKYSITKQGSTIGELKVSTLKSEMSLNDSEDPLFAAAVVMAIRIALYYTQVAGAASGAAVNVVR